MTVISEELSAMMPQWRFQHSTVQVTHTPEPALLVPANPLRWGIVFTCLPDLVSPNDGVWIGVDATVSPTAGIFIAPLSGREWNFRQWGSWVGQNWFGIGNSAAVPTIDIWEIIAQQ